MKQFIRLLVILSIYPFFLTHADSTDLVQKNNASPQVPSVSAPAVPSAFIQYDLRDYPVNQLVGMATSAYENQDYKDAAQFQYWAMTKGHDGFYDMAYYSSLAGDVNSALYWLIKDAQEGAPNVAWTEQDSDLANVHASEQWPQVKQYIADMENYWHNSKMVKHVVYVPESYQQGDSLPLVIGLHGRGDSPDNFLHQSYQNLANQMGIAFLGISGPIVEGKNAFAWSTDSAVNAEQVETVYRQVIKDKQLSISTKALFGFSQGAQVSIDIAANNPEDWKGALALSPGLYPVERVVIKENIPTLKDQTYFITNGENEHSYNLGLSENDIQVLEQKEASVQHFLYPDAGHQFPTDYYDRFPGWVSSILDLSF